MASERLFEAGISLKTDARWFLPNHKKDWVLARWRFLVSCQKAYPAPSMAEVWRELPCWLEGYRSLMITKSAGDELVCGYQKGLAVRDPMRRSINPTDALIDLLIHIKGIDAHK